MGGLWFGCGLEFVNYMVCGVGCGWVCCVGMLCGVGRFIVVLL